MVSPRGGSRPGAGRKKGSKNKMTLARESVAEILDAPDTRSLTAHIHQRGHELITELEEIVFDKSQPTAVRIMAARTALPFLLPKQEEQVSERKPITEVVWKIVNVDRDGNELVEK